jgi:Multidrug resistance efflux pump
MPIEKTPLYITPNLHAELADEIISQEPSFVEKSLLWWISGFILLVLALMWIIQYPDTVNASAVLTADNAPKEILSRQEGRIAKLFRKNDDVVKQGDVIAWMESTANTQDILNLSAQLDKIILALTTGENGKGAFSAKYEYYHLGELQQAYNDFSKSLVVYRDYFINGFYERKLRTLRGDLATLALQKEAITEQLLLHQQDFELAEKSTRIYEELAKDRSVSAEELRKQQSVHIGKKLQIPQLKENLLRYETTTRDKESEIDILTNEVTKQKAIFYEATMNLRGQMDNWMKKYIIRAPVDGKIVFSLPLQESQYLPADKILGYVNPSESGYFLEAKLAQSKFGKVDTGMTVKMEFDAYPGQEFGYIYGRVDYISRVAVDSGFIALIKLNEGLKTTQHFEVAYKYRLHANCQIITKKKNLLQRLFEGFLKDRTF